MCKAMLGALLGLCQNLLADIKGFMQNEDLYMKERRMAYGQTGFNTFVECYLQFLLPSYKASITNAKLMQKPFQIEGMISL